MIKDIIFAVIMTKKQKALNVAKQMGIALFRDNYGMIQADAPKGMCFSQDLHVLICDDWDDLINRLTSYSLEKCEIHNCDTCTEVKEYMTAPAFAHWMNWELILDSDKF